MRPVGPHRGRGRSARASTVLGRCRVRQVRSWLLSVRFWIFVLGYQAFSRAVTDYVYDTLTVSLQCRKSQATSKFILLAGAAAAPYHCCLVGLFVLCISLHSSYLSRKSLGLFDQTLWMHD